MPPEHADRLVRAARPADVPAMAELQVTTWRTVYAPLLPPHVLEALDAAEVEASWRDAVLEPPTRRHDVLVAVDEGQLAGFAALGPADDSDADDRTGEIYALLVEPGFFGRGHGSRLLAAAIESLRERSFTRATTWLFEVNTGGAAFFTSAGWAPDRSRRALDMGEPVAQIRLHTEISAETT